MLKESLYKLWLEKNEYKRESSVQLLADRLDIF